MRVDIRPDDRLHMLVWKSTATCQWCVAPALNGSPIDKARDFTSWREAFHYATGVGAL